MIETNDDRPKLPPPGAEENSRKHQVKEEFRKPLQSPTQDFHDRHSIALCVIEGSASDLLFR